MTKEQIHDAVSTVYGRTAFIHDSLCSAMQSCAGERHWKTARAIQAALGVLRNDELDTITSRLTALLTEAGNSNG